MDFLKLAADRYSVRKFTDTHLEQEIIDKIYLDKNKEFPLSRDNINFPKISVLRSKDNKYFLRILFNTFISENIVEEQREYLDITDSFVIKKDLFMI